MPLEDQEYGSVLSEEQEKEYQKSILEPMAKDMKELAYLRGETTLGSGRELPRWQTEPKNLIEDVMAQWLGPVKTEADYQGVMDRLKYLKAYLPSLRGHLLSQAQSAIKLLEERVSEYQRSNLKAYMTQIYVFVKNPIADDAAFNTALEYYNSLTVMRPSLRGMWAQAVDKYAAWLKERMEEFRGTTPKPVKLESPQDQVAAQLVPDIVRPFVITTDTSWKEHKADSQYCRVATIREGREWVLGFEEGDEAYAAQDPSFAPDWDYDEPILRVILTDNVLNITTEKYGGYTHACRINYGGTVLWARVGGDRDRHVGETIGLDLNTMKVVAPGKVPFLSLESIKKILPWGIAAGALGTTAWFVAKKK